MKNAKIFSNANGDSVVGFHKLLYTDILQKITIDNIPINIIVEDNYVLYFNDLLELKKHTIEFGIYQYFTNQLKFNNYQIVDKRIRDNGLVYMVGGCLIKNNEYYIFLV